MARTGRQVAGLWGGETNSETVVIIQVEEDDLFKTKMLVSTGKWMIEGKFQKESGPSQIRWIRLR